MLIKLHGYMYVGGGSRGATGAISPPPTNLKWGQWPSSKAMHGYQYCIINPRHMHEGYGSRSVCLSVTMLAATYLIFKSQMKCYRVLHGVFNRCIVWILLKTLRSKVLA